MRFGTAWLNRLRERLGDVPVSVAHERHRARHLHLEVLVAVSSPQVVSVLRRDWMDEVALWCRATGRRAFLGSASAVARLVVVSGGLRYALKGIQCDDEVLHINWPAYDPTRRVGHADAGSFRSFKRKLPMRPFGRPPKAIIIARRVAEWIVQHPDRDPQALADIPGECIRRELFSRATWAKAMRMTRLRARRPDVRGRFTAGAWTLANERP